MTLGELKQYIESFPDGTKFDYSLSEPFSWRGVYSEVAFTINENESTREELLEKINRALTQTFFGWKGGDFTYSEHTNVNFEESHRSWSDGEYTENWISKLMNVKAEKSPEHRLLKLLFPNKNK